MTTQQIAALEKNACEIGDLAGEALRYIDATNIAHAHPAEVLTLRILIAEVERRAGALIDLSNGD